MSATKSIVIGHVGDEIALQPVRRNLVPVGADWLDPIDLHQPADTTLTNSETDLFQLCGHPRTALAAEAQPTLLSDVGQHLYIHTCMLADRL